MKQMNKSKFLIVALMILSLIFFAIINSDTPSSIECTETNPIEVVYNDERYTIITKICKEIEWK